MDNYYVNNKAQNTGEHEVHKEGCQYFPSDRAYLGSFSTCQEAVQKARTIYSNVDGCFYCSPACHKKQQFNKCIRSFLTLGLAGETVRVCAGHGTELAR